MKLRLRVLSSERDYRGTLFVIKMKSLMKHNNDLLGQVILTQNSRVEGFLFRVFKDNKTSWLRQRDNTHKDKDILRWTL